MDKYRTHVDSAVGSYGSLLSQIESDISLRVMAHRIDAHELALLLRLSKELRAMLCTYESLQRSFEIEAVPAPGDSASIVHLSHFRKDRAD
ncbi:MAG: hypothetical protein ACK4QP_02445 [Pseudorhizobium sp.]